MNLDLLSSQLEDQQARIERVQRMAQSLQQAVSVTQGVTGQGAPLEYEKEGQKHLKNVTLDVERVRVGLLAGNVSGALAVLEEMQRAPVQYLDVDYQQELLSARQKLSRAEAACELQKQEIGVLREENLRLKSELEIGRRDADAGRQLRERCGDLSEKLQELQAQMTGMEHRNTFLAQQNTALSQAVDEQRNTSQYQESLARQQAQETQKQLAAAQEAIRNKQMELEQERLQAVASKAQLEQQETQIAKASAEIVDLKIIVQKQEGAVAALKTGLRHDAEATLQAAQRIQAIARSVSQYLGLGREKFAAKLDKISQFIGALVQLQSKQEAELLELRMSQTNSQLAAQINLVQAQNSLLTGSFTAQQESTRRRQVQQSLQSQLGEMTVDDLIQELGRYE